MRSKVYSIGFVLAVSFILIAFIGCEYLEGPAGPEGAAGPQGPEGPPGETQVFISGSIGQFWEQETYAVVCIAFTPTIPVVTINDIQLGYYPLSNPLLFHIDAFPISPGDSAKLLVTYEKTDGGTGIAESHTKLPNEFGITFPDTSDTYFLDVGEPLSVSWSTSEGSDGYRFYTYIYYQYSDTLGNLTYSNIFKDTILTSNNIVIPASFIFPNESEIDSFVWGGGHIEVASFHGPYQEGDPVNVTGDATGYFYGCAYGGDIDIEIIGANPLVMKKEDPEERMREFHQNRLNSLY